MTVQNKVGYTHIESMIGSLDYKLVHVGDGKTTGCYSYLPNGFQVAYGDSACVDPANFDKGLGEKYAKERCVVASSNKLWELEGYLLKVTGKTSDQF